jgi:LPXTG-site transpeptidase (sortase) family protein
MRYLLSIVAAGAFAFMAFVGNPIHTTYADSVDTALYGTSDTLVISSLGINAPVNTRNVGEDGTMGDPLGKDDVVRYDFPAFPGLGGYPGNGGTTVVAGHVDYHPNFQAVFWTLRDAQVGTRIDYYRFDGTVVSYAVDWIDKVGGDDDVGQYMVSSSPESMLLITCDGVFDPSTRHYNNRSMVHAVRIS